MEPPTRASTSFFCAECAQAIDALKLTMPPELKALIDTNVIEFKSQDRPAR